MPLDLNPSVYLTVDEDQGVSLVAAASPAFNNAAVEALVTSLAAEAVAPTADFGTPQTAVEGGLFSIDPDTVNLSFSSDGSGLTAFSTTSGIDSGLTLADGTKIYLFSGGDDDVVVGRIADDPTAKIAFTLALDEQVVDGKVTGAQLWITQYAAVRHDGQDVVDGDIRTFADKLFVASTELYESVASNFGDVPAGAPVFAILADDAAGTGPGTVQVLATAYKSDDAGTSTNEEHEAQTVNISDQGSFPGSLAPVTQNMTPGTGLRLDFVENGYTGYSNGKDAANIAFDDHAQVTKAGFAIVQNQGGRDTDIQVRAYDVATTAQDADGASFFGALGDATAVTIDNVRVTLLDPANPSASPTVLFDSTLGAANPGLVQVEGLGTGVVIVRDMQLNYNVEIINDLGHGFERLDVTNVDADKNAFVDIGRLSYAYFREGSDNVEIGSRVAIDDSGPSIAAQAAAPDWSVDESGLPAGTDAANPAQTADHHSVADSFAVAFGADGPGALGYALKIPAAGTDSGLVDTLTGDPVLLRLTAGGVVEGYCQDHASDVAFTVEVDATGELTLTQLRALVHPDPAQADEGKSMAADLIKVVATVTDSEGFEAGDSASAELSVSERMTFHDDAPALHPTDPTSAVLTTDDDTLGSDSASFAYLFDAVPGADGGAAASDYALSVEGSASGLKDCASKQDILLKMETGKVVGYFMDGAAQVNCFTVAVDKDTGEVTLTQLRSIQHIVGGVPTDDPVSLIGGAVKLSASIEDGDHDPVSATADIGKALAFADAQPEITTPDDTTILYKTGANNAETFAVDMNNDGPGSHVTIDKTTFVYEGPLDAKFNADSTRVDFYEGATLRYHLGVTDTGYQVVVDSQPNGGIQELLFNKIPAGAPRETLTVELGNDGGGHVTLDGLVFDPKKTATYNDPNSVNNNPGAKSDADDLNPDNLGFGVKGGQASQINPNEGFKFAYTPGAGEEDHEIDNLTFHVQGIGNLNEVNVRYWLFNDNGTASTADDILVDGGLINVKGLFDPKNVTGNYTLPVTLKDLGQTPGAHAAAGETFDYGVVRFEFQSSNGNVANQGVRVTDFSIQTDKEVLPDDFTFQLKVTDCDADTVLTDPVHVQLEGWMI